MLCRSWYFCCKWVVVLLCLKNIIFTLKNGMLPFFLKLCLFCYFYLLCDDGNIIVVLYCCWYCFRAWVVVLLCLKNIIFTLKSGMLPFFLKLCLFCYCFMYCVVMAILLCFWYCCWYCFRAWVVVLLCLKNIIFTLKHGMLPLFLKLCLFCYSSIVLCIVR